MSQNFNLNQLTRGNLSSTDKETLRNMSLDELNKRKKWYISRKKYLHAQFCSNLIISRKYETKPIKEQHV